MDRDEIRAIAAQVVHEVLEPLVVVVSTGGAAQARLEIRRPESVCLIDPVGQGGVALERVGRADVRLIRVIRLVVGEQIADAGLRDDPLSPPRAVAAVVAPGHRDVLDRVRRVGRTIRSPIVKPGAVQRGDLLRPSAKALLGVAENPGRSGVFQAELLVEAAIVAVDIRGVARVGAVAVAHIQGLQGVDSGILRNDPVPAFVGGHEVPELGGVAVVLVGGDGRSIRGISAWRWRNY